MLKSLFTFGGWCLVFLVASACSPTVLTAAPNPTQPAHPTKPTVRPPLEPSPSPAPTSLPEKTGLLPSPTQPALVTPALPSTGWSTYTNKDMGLALDYPPDWSVEESAGRASFTSPEGRRIDLAVVDTGSLTPEEFLAKEQLPNTRCSTRINPYEVTIKSCLDTISFSTTAYFSLPSSAQLLSLNLIGRGNFDVFNAMLDSVRSS